MQDSVYTATEHTSSRARQSWMLLHASIVFSCTRNVEELLKAICDKMTQALETANCEIYLLDEDGKNLILRSSSGSWDLRAESVSSYSLQSLPRYQQSLTLGEPIVVVDDDPSLVSRELEWQLLFRERNCTVLLMPLSLPTRPLGLAVLRRNHHQTSTFTNDEIELCHLMAHLGALAMQNISVLERISNQTREFKMVIDSVADGIIQTDLDRRIVTFNPAAEKLIGYSAEEIQGRTCMELLQGQGETVGSLCTDKCPLCHLSSGGADPEPFMEWITRRDGNRILLSGRAMPIVDGNKRPIGAVTVFRDVTREEELTRLKSEFISMVSHELRTPLTNIGSIAGLLATLDLPGAEQKEMLHELNKQCLRLLRLVDQVLEASRLDKGKIAPALEPLSLLPLVEQVVSVYRAQYKEYSFEIRTPGRPIRALGDSMYLQVVLENVIQNAVNYSPSGSTITVFVEERGEEICLIVEDQGVGIPADQLESIFQRFHRIPDGPSKKVTGFGLGLYIARMLMQAQNGRIWAEQKPGRGSRLCLVLKPLRSLDEKDSDHR